jgi:hypothetical protein
MVKAPAGSQDIVNFVSCLYIRGPRILELPNIVPQCIYNLHYGNGEPAMFTSHYLRLGTKKGQGNFYELCMFIV